MDASVSNQSRKRKGLRNLENADDNHGSDSNSRKSSDGESNTSDSEHVHPRLKRHRVG